MIAKRVYNYNNYRLSMESTTIVIGAIQAFKPTYNIGGPHIVGMFGTFWTQTEYDEIRWFHDDRDQYWDAVHGADAKFAMDSGGDD